ncbi:hypothetical protein [Orf virus]|nr:hypothetical protein [Orf virus]
MDEALRVAARVVDGLRPLDVAVCLAQLRGAAPERRFPALDECSGEAFLDFEFAGGDVASRYLSAHTRELRAAERREHMAAIARCVTEADLALSDRPRGKARAALRVCRNREKVARLARLLRDAESSGADFAFIRAAVA